MRPRSHQNIGGALASGTVRGGRNDAMARRRRAFVPCPWSSPLTAGRDVPRAKGWAPMRHGTH